MYILIALSVVAAWGINSSVMKIGITDFPIFLFLAIRFLVTGIIFLPFSTLKKKEIPDLLKIALSFNVLHISLISFSLYFLTASSSVTIQQIQVPMALLLSVIVFKEKIGAAQIAGISIAILGIVIIYGIPEVNFIGFMFTIISAFFFAISQLFFKKTDNISLPTFVAWTSLLSVPFFVVLSLIFDNEINVEKIEYGKFTIVMAFQIFVMGCSTAVWQKVVSLHGVNKIAPLALLTAVFGIIGGMVLLDETITFEKIVGTTVIISGVALTTLFKPKDDAGSKVIKEKDFLYIEE